MPEYPVGIANKIAAEADDEVLIEITRTNNVNTKRIELHNEQVKKCWQDQIDDLSKT